MLLALILVVGLTLFLCWLLFALASLALPVFVGALVAHACWQSGAGLVGSAVVGLVTGGATLFVGQFLLATLRGTGSRLAIVLLFAAPAAVAGFSATRGIAAIGGATSGWQIALALGGSACVAIAAITRFGAALPDQGGGDAQSSHPVQPAPLR